MVELFRSPRRLLLLLFEVALVGFLVLVASSVRLGLHEGVTYPDIGKKCVVAGLVFGSSFYYSGLYDFSISQSARMVFSRVLKALPLAGLAMLVLFYLLPFLELGRGVFLVTMALVAVVVPSWRVLYNAVSESAPFHKRTLILGNGPLAHELAGMIRERPALGLELVGMLSRDRHHVNPEQGVVGVYKDLLRVVELAEVELVLVAYPDRRGTLPVEQLLEAKFRGVTVEEGVEFYERETGKIFVRELKPSQLIFAEGFSARPGTQRLKRLIDVFVASLGLTLAAPLMFFTSMLIKLDSKGPILYGQVRAGQFGRLFTIYKFRSMRTDAEKHGAQFAKENDDRVTRVGRFIRKTRLDELPQLWNVLRGDMSMVGPRPERPVFIEKLEQEVPYFKQRLYVKPGLTGHAQVRCRYGANTEDMLEKLQYDLYYIKSQSVLFDLSILVDTVKVVLLRIGAR